MDNSFVVSATAEMLFEVVDVVEVVVVVVALVVIASVVDTSVKEPMVSNTLTVSFVCMIETFLLILFVVNSILTDLNHFFYISVSHLL